MKKIVRLGVSKVFRRCSILHCSGVSFLKSGSKTEWLCYHASQLTFTLGCSILQCLNYYNSQSRFLRAIYSGLDQDWCGNAPWFFSPSAICAKNSQNVARMWTKPFRLFEPARLRIFIYFLIYWAILSLKSAEQKIWKLFWESWEKYFIF